MTGPKDREGHEIVLRRAAPGDMRHVWEIANDPIVRAASFGTDFIPWEEHVDWFREAVNSPHYAFYVCKEGYARFLLAPFTSSALISVALRERSRGKGLGTALIREATQRLYDEEAHIHTVLAQIKSDNVISHRAFKSAGYHFSYNNGDFDIYIYKRSGDLVEERMNG